MTEIQRDIGPRNPPVNAGEDPFLVWIRYGLGDLFFAAGQKMGPAVLDEVPPWLDGLRFVVLDALQEAKQRLREPRYTPVGIRIDTSELTPKEADQ